MDLSAVITQLKTYAPVFNGNVAGSADYATGLETVVSLPLPSAYAYPLDDDPELNSDMGSSLRQTVAERIAVVICISNTSDRRGQTAVDTVESIKYDVFKAVLNWNPFLDTSINATARPRANQGLQYAGGHLIGFDRARLWWQFEFVIISTIGTSDGFTYTGEQLTEIVLNPTNFPPVQVGVTFPTVLSTCSTFKFSATGSIS